MCLDYMVKLLEMWPTRTTERGEGTWPGPIQQELWNGKAEENSLCMLISQFYHFQYVHPHCTNCWIWHNYINYAAEGSIHVFLWNISVNLITYNLQHHRISKHRRLQSQQSMSQNMKTYTNQEGIWTWHGLGVIQIILSSMKEHQKGSPLYIYAMVRRGTDAVVVLNVYCSVPHQQF